jgi:tetratricopeptide (TPR) repeat protein
MDALYRGEWESGGEELRMAIALAEENGSIDAQANALAALGLVELGRGDHIAARATAQRALEVAGEIGSAATQLTALNVLALTQLAQGEPVDARRLAEEAAVIAGRTREMQQLVRSAEILAAVAVEQGDPERALRLVASAAGFRDKLHIARTRPEQDRFDLTWSGLERAFGPARLGAWQEEACGSLAELVACCLEPATTPA